MTMEPLYDRILVEQILEEEKANSIILPETSKEKPNIGKVKAVGYGRIDNGTLVPLIVKEGDTILFGKFSGTTIEFDGQQYLFMRETDVFAIIRK